MEGYDLARNLLRQEPGRDNRHADAASTPKVSDKARRRNAPVYSVTFPEGRKLSLNAVKGRVAWALDRLIAAGPKGCTPISEPGPRWSAYVHVLREQGVAIETVRERHGGDYPGPHGRYVLRCDVRRVGE
jgi:hypothetical protein